MTQWATYYDEIPEALSNNDQVRSHSVDLISEERMIAKSLEGGTRIEDFKEILTDVFQGRIDQSTAVQRVSQELPESESPYQFYNQVFNS